MKQIWHPYTFDFKNVRSYTSTATYAFMVRSGMTTSQNQKATPLSQVKGIHEDNLNAVHDSGL
jgi:hypothetical protein